MCVSQLTTEHKKSQPTPDFTFAIRDLLDEPHIGGSAAEDVCVLYEHFPHQLVAGQEDDGPSEHVGCEDLGELVAPFGEHGPNVVVFAEQHVDEAPSRWTCRKSFGFVQPPATLHLQRLQGNKYCCDTIGARVTHRPTRILVHPPEQHSPALFRLPKLTQQQVKRRSLCLQAHNFLNIKLTST